MQTLVSARVAASVSAMQRSPSAQSVSVPQRCRHTSRTQLLLGPQLLLLLPAPQLIGVRTQPCWGSGEPLRGIPGVIWGLSLLKRVLLHNILGFRPSNIDPTNSKSH